MNEEKREPDFTKAVDIQAFFYNEFGGCGCSNLGAMIKEVKGLLEWIDNKRETNINYDKLFNGNEGVYYLMVGALDRVELCEHGISIRHPWLTDKGKSLLKALREFSSEEIKEANGKAYDGCWYNET